VLLPSLVASGPVKLRGTDGWKKILAVLSQRRAHMRCVTRLLLAGLMLSVQTSWAQDAKNADVRPHPEGVKRAAARQEDLKFPAKASGLGIFSGLENGFFKPDGAGPFPPSCCSIRAEAFAMIYAPGPRPL